MRTLLLIAAGISLAACAKNPPVPPTQEPCPFPQQRQAGVCVDTDGSNGNPGDPPAEMLRKRT